MDEEALRACWDEQETPSLERCDWFSSNTFHHRQFADLERLLEAKKGKGVSVSVCLPSLNVEPTIGEIVRTIRMELVERVPLVDELVVVLGHHAQRIEPVVAEFPVTLVRNPHPEQGQASSTRVGLQALAAVDCVLVALADQPLLHAQDVADLIKAYKQRPEGIELVQPQVDGQPGNPLVFSAAVREQILAGPGDVACRRWQERHAGQVLRWPTANRRYAVDIDTEQDIEELAQRTGHRLRWPRDLAPAAVQP